MFPIITVPDDTERRLEHLGTKFKFWYEDADSRLCLYKQTRDNTGEDWAEKIAEYICELLELPHAGYELAEWQGKHGVISASIIRENERLFPGNELLTESVPAYEAATTRRGINRFHTVNNVLRCLHSYAAPTLSKPIPAITNAAEGFVGYLLLDALIGNGDRHHENWGCIATSNGTDVRLAPTYDHASSLGREWSDAKRYTKLTTRDKNNSVEAYARRGSSALYENIGDADPLLLVDAFQIAATQYPTAAQAWLQRLENITENDFRRGFTQISPERISGLAVEFGVRLLIYNRKRLLEIEKQEQ